MTATSIAKSKTLKSSNNLLFFPDRILQRPDPLDFHPIGIALPEKPLRGTGYADTGRRSR